MKINRVQLIALLSDLKPKFVEAEDESVDHEIKLGAVPNFTLQLCPNGVYVGLNEWNETEQAMYYHGMWDFEDDLTMRMLAYKIRVAIKAALA